jgi:hypothetical protein
MLTSILKGSFDFRFSGIPMRTTMNDLPGSIESTHQQGLVSTAHPGLALAAALLGFFVITLDAVVINVALPAIRTNLGGAMIGLQWVVDGYTLMFAALLLSAGSLSNRIGARHDAQARATRGRDVIYFVPRERRTFHGYQTRWLTAFRQRPGRLVYRHGAD